jgi:hypothetical protein
MSAKTCFRNADCPAAVERLGDGGVADGPGTVGSLSTSEPSRSDVVVVAGTCDVEVVAFEEFVDPQAPRTVITTSETTAMPIGRAYLKDAQVFFEVVSR